MAEKVIQGRGVLIDIHKHHGLGAVIGWEELKAIMDKDGVEVKEGDLVMFHTGFGRLLMENRGGNVTPEIWQNALGGLDGRDPGIQDWVTRSGVAALISDNLSVEAFPNNRTPRVGRGAALGIHELCLFKLGCYLGELWSVIYLLGWAVEVVLTFRPRYLSDLADYLNERKRHAVLLTAPPLRLPGAVGSPANGGFESIGV